MILHRLVVLSAGAVGEIRTMLTALRIFAAGLVAASLVAAPAIAVRQQSVASIVAAAR